MTSTSSKRYSYPLIAIVASSGAGKTTLGQRLLAEARLPRVISCTTRARRPDEFEDAYRFLSEPAFREGIASGAFAEWAEPFAGLFYGRLWADLDALLNRGPAFADMTEHGVRAFREQGIDLVCIRIEPRNHAVLVHAAARAADDAARTLIPIEIDATVVNDHGIPDGLDRAYRDLLAAIRAHVALPA